jgi:hypothetical protein
LQWLSRSFALPLPGDVSQAHEMVGRAALVDRITIRINVIIMSFHERKRPAQGVLNSDEIPTLVFLTVCTDLRGRWLANHETHQLLRKVWLESTAWKNGPISWLIRSEPA